MVEARRRQLQRHDLAAEDARHLRSRRRIGALAIAGPEQLPRGVPDAVAGALVDEPGRELDDLP